jgi:hypothetical protein
LKILLAHGLEKRAVLQYQNFLADQAAVLREEAAMKAAHVYEMSKHIRESETTYGTALRQVLLDSLAERFPCAASLPLACMSDVSSSSGLDFGPSDSKEFEKSKRWSSSASRLYLLTYITSTVRLEQLTDTFPAMAPILQDIFDVIQQCQITTPEYEWRRERFLLVESVLKYVHDGENSDQRPQQELINTILETRDHKELVAAFQLASHDYTTSSSWVPNTNFWRKGELSVDAKVKAILDIAHHMDDSVFLPCIITLANQEPLLAGPVANMAHMATKYLQDTMEQRIASVLRRLKLLEEDGFRRSSESDLAQVRSNGIGLAQKAFLASTTDAFINDPWYAHNFSLVPHHVAHIFSRVDVIDNVKKSGLGNWQYSGFRSPYSSGGMV